MEEYGEYRRYWMNRTLCDVLEDMRNCHKTHNYAPLLSLIEEAQVMGNRMESALADKKDLLKMHEEWHELRAKINKARKEAKALGIDKETTDGDD